MITSLPMYWRAETAAHWQAFWRHVQAAAPDLPDLTPLEALPDLVTHWRDPRLAVSMTCSLPFRSLLRGHVTYVGTLDFGLGGPLGHYQSVQIARPGDPARARLARNEAGSQSGWAVAAGGDWAEVIDTGSHAASLAAVAGGQADTAFLDAVTWRLLQRADPAAGAVEVVARTVFTPGLPLITAKGRDPAPLRQAFAAACAAFRPAEPAALGGPLSFVVLDEAAYLDLPLPD